MNTEAPQIDVAQVSSNLEQLRVKFKVLDLEHEFEAILHEIAELLENKSRTHAHPDK